MHRHFLEYFLKIMNMSKLTVMIDVILLILHVMNGIYKKIHNVIRE